MKEFINALVSEKPNEKIADKLNLFGQFVGELDFDWIDKKGTASERHIKEEWLFSWVLDGNAVQDVFICPSRSTRNINSQPDAEYGTTLRFYNIKKDAWDIFYGCPGEASILEARAEGEKIVLKGINCEDYKSEWVFSDIKKNSFHWQCVLSFDDGNTWTTTGELFACRRV